jgi:NAD(P)-dependent dehydrogenase (short-subunit alcohol dehydrogenase family)
VGAESYAKDLVNLAIETYSRLDIAFNNTGILGETVPFTELSLATWQETLQVNLTGAFLGAKHQIR